MKRNVDVIRDLLNAVLNVQPVSYFFRSLLYQYNSKGRLSKRQLQILRENVDKIEMIQPQKIVTLDAILLERPTRYKSEKPALKPTYIKNQELEGKINSILEKYPKHKRVLFYKAKYDNNVIFTSSEESELSKFVDLLL